MRLLLLLSVLDPYKLVERDLGTLVKDHEFDLTSEGKRKWVSHLKNLFPA